MKNDVIDLIEKDHRTVMDLFRQIQTEKKENEEKRKRIFNEVAGELRLHTQGEEKVVYPVLETSAFHDLYCEFTADHKKVETLVTEIEELSPSNELWADKMEELETNVEEHVDKEETELFRDLRTLCDDERLLELGTEFEQAKKAFEETKAA